MGENRWATNVFFKDDANQNVRIASIEPIDDMSWVRRQLPVAGRGLEVRPSQVSGGGFGVFTTRPFAKYEIVTFYSGAVLAYVTPSMLGPKMSTHPRVLAGLRFTIIGNVVEDGSAFIESPADMRGRGVGAFINDARGTKFGYNVDFKTLRDAENDRDPFADNPGGLLSIIMATTDIAAGSELFVDYGNDYWEREPPVRPTVNTLADVRNLLANPRRPATVPVALHTRRRIHIAPVRSLCDTCADGTLARGTCVACRAVSFCSEACFGNHASECVSSAQH